MLKNFRVFPVQKGYVFYGDKKSGMVFLAKLLETSDQPYQPVLNKPKELVAYMDLDSEDIIFITDNKEWAQRAIKLMGGGYE